MILELILLHLANLSITPVDILVELAKLYNLIVIVEGIEAEKQPRYFCALDCHEVLII